MVSSIIAEPAARRGAGQSRSQCLVVELGISIGLFALHIRRLWRTQHVENASAFSVEADVGLMFQFEGYVFVTDGAHQRAVAGAAMLDEHVVAHDALATYRDPKIWSLRSRQGSPPRMNRPGLYTENPYGSGW